MANNLEAIRDLLGVQLNKIVYYETIEEGGEHFGEHQPKFDSLDFGLDVVSTAGLIVSFAWNAVQDWELAIERHSLSEDLKQHKRKEVSDLARWHLLLGKTIVEVGVFEKTYDSHDPALEHVMLKFQTGDVVLISSAKYFEGSDSVSEFADNVLVTFSDEIMRAYRLGPYSEGASPTTMKVSLI